MNISRGARNLLNTADMEEIAARDGRFHHAALCFMQDCLKKLNDKSYGIEELIKTFSNSLLKSYGPFASFVLSQMGIKDAQDVAEILRIFHCNGFVTLEDEESLADYSSLVDFHKQFRVPFTAEPPFPDMPAIR